MFGSSTSPATTKDDETAVDTNSATDDTKPTTAPIPINTSNGPDKRESEDSPASAGPKMTDDSSSDPTRKRRTSGVRAMFSDAKNSLREMGSSPKSPDSKAQTPIQKLAKTDAALSVAQGSLNNSAGESAPGPRSTFRVGVTEDKNKKCRRTMEDTHAYLYNFLSTPAPLIGADAPQKNRASTDEASSNRSLADQVVETDNGYFAIFDGHAGTFAADWCGKKLHLLLEDTIRKNPNTPIPELLDQTFTLVDQQLEKLPLKNSGCTAVIAVLRWEDRVPNSHSATGSAFLGSAAAAAAKAANDTSASATDASQAAQNDITPTDASAEHAPEARLRQAASRQRVLYTANVGDARIVLCRNGRALRLSYDHKGSDENEGRRVSNAGGLILNNRVNGVLAVTRALGDSYMKDLVTGHPYTTETVIQPDQDEFLILACDGLWDVCSDQEAVDLVRNVQDPQAASKTLVDHALARFSTDNLSCMIVRFNNEALKVQKTESAVGVDSDRVASQTGVSEATAIVEQSKKNLSATGELNENITADSIMEEEAEDQEPGPELNVDALKAKQVNHV